MSKLCINCKHFRGRAAYHECEATQNILVRKPPSGFRLVDNVQKKEHSYAWLTCDMLRSFNWLSARLFHACGKEGRWFEEKPL